MFTVPQKDSSLAQFHDRLCIDYPGSGVPRAECSQAVGWDPPWPGSSLTETFTPLKCLIAAERLITVLCLTLSVDIRGFYAFVHKELHHHTLFHACTNTVVLHPD